MLCVVHSIVFFGNGNIDFELNYGSNVNGNIVKLVVSTSCV